MGLHDSINRKKWPNPIRVTVLIVQAMLFKMQLTDGSVLCPSVLILS